MNILADFWYFLAGYLVFCAWENTRLFVKPPALDRKRKKWPFVSILIPARNEEKRIKPCLRGMLTQDYPSYEILVLDDRSTDDTFNLVESYSKRNRQLKVLRGKELPKGWLGKPWACYELSKKAKGEWLFFTDADTWHHPETLKRTVQMAEGKQADILSLFTKQITKTWMEALVVPVMAFHLLAFVPARWTLDRKNPLSRFAGVSGQFIFIRRKVYEAFGGHTVVKNEIVEDLKFGMQAVKRGYRVVIGNGCDFSFCRMYTTAREVWDGFSKNFFPAVGFSIPNFLQSFGFLILVGVAPFLALMSGPSSSIFLSALTLVMTLWGIRTLEAFLYGFNKTSVIFHPVGCLLFALVGLNSARWFWHKRRGHWKGRVLHTPSR